MSSLYELHRPRCILAASARLSSRNGLPAGMGKRERTSAGGEWGQAAQLVRVARFYLVWAKKKGQLNPGFPVGLVSFLVWPAMAETAFLLLDLAEHKKFRSNIRSAFPFL